MKTSNFKLKFQTSQITNCTSPITISKILTKLQNKKYEICEITDTNITFKWSTFRLVSNSNALYILDGGEFEISKSEEGTIVILSYFINTWYYLIIIIAFITFLVIQGAYFGILFFGIFFLMAAGFQYTITKNAGEELLTDMLDED